MQGRLARRVRGNLLRNCGCRGVFRQYTGSARYYAAPPGMFLHVIARSEATWQSVLLAATQSEREYLWRIRKSVYEFARSSASLPGFPAETRIATPRRPKVRHAPRRLKARGEQRSLGAPLPAKGHPLQGPHALVRNNRQKAGAAGRGNGAVSHDFRKSC